jgi:hypothetical protein
MAINQLGRINFADLARYLFKSADAGLLQTYMEAYFKELSLGLRTPGIVYGGKVTVASGLTLNISRGLAVFSDGQLIAWDDHQVTLSAADPSNPRIDRVELGYSLTNGSTVANIDLLPVILDKRYTEASTPNAGTPAGSPVAPALTAGKFSLATVNVAAAQTILTSNDISQVPATAFSFSAGKFGDSNHLIRYNPSTDILEVTNDGGTSWYPLLVEPSLLQSFTLANNQATTNVTGLILDKTKRQSALIACEVHRKTSTTEAIAVGFLKCIYRALTDTWDIADELSGDDHGVTFTIDPTTGQVKYATTNYSSGTGYTGTLKYRLTGF